MFRFLALALTAAGSAYLASSAVMAFNPNHGAPAARAETVRLSEPAPSPASISKAADGHYWAEADVNGSQVRFLVDTGASAVALTPHDARRLGLQPETLSYTYSVNTAAGTTRAAQVHLASIAVAGARVNNVEAFVIEEGLDTSLLGMSYLGRLSRFEATPTSLILRP